MSPFWQEVLSRPRDIFARLSRGQRVGVLALVSIGIVVAVLSSLLAGRQSYTLLYGGLESQDVNAIAAKLAEGGILYKVTPDAGGILVPEGRVPEIKLMLAGAGLPKTGSRGFEIFDDSQLGITDALFNVNLQRALQGSLERDIEACDGVKKASVLIHLAPPAIFARDKRHATASVTLWLRPGMPISEQSVAAIANLVAYGVGYGMRAQDVMIMDSVPNLLHPRGSSEGPMANLAYLQNVQSIERGLQESAESALRVALGDGKAVVRVSVELDLNYKETQKETLGPENAVPVRESESMSRTRTAGSTGDPSVVPADGTVVDADGTVIARETLIEDQSESEKEYKEGRTRELQISAAGAVKRLSVSLLLDASNEAVMAEGAKDQLSDAVKTAVGFSKLRKDEFHVAIVPFAKAPAGLEIPSSFSLESLLPLAVHLTEAVTVLFVLFLLAKVLRGGSSAPVNVKVKGKVVAAGAGGDVRTTMDKDALDLSFADGKGPDMRTRLGRFVERHPEQAREVLVAWLKEEMAS